MSGVARINQNTAKCAIPVRGKKWYACIVTHCIDVAITNTWQLHRVWEGKDAMDLLAFRRRIGHFYLEHFAYPPCKDK